METGTVKLNNNMLFELNDGTTLIISKEDTEKIAIKIMIEAMIYHKRQNSLTITHEYDSKTEDINTIREMLKDEKMPEELRSQYYSTLLDLLKQEINGISLQPPTD